MRKTDGLNLSANDQLRTSRQFFPARLDDFVQVAGHTAQISALHSAVNIDQGLDVVMRNHGQSSAPANRCQVGEDSETAATWSGYRNVLQVLQSFETILRRLRRDEIAHAGFRIEPEFRSSLKTSAQ